jgi:hypothetical protein
VRAVELVDRTGLGGQSGVGASAADFRVTKQYSGSVGGGPSNWYRTPYFAPDAHKDLIQNYRTPGRESAYMEPWLQA